MWTKKSDHDSQIDKRSEIDDNEILTLLGLTGFTLKQEKFDQNP